MQEILVIDSVGLWISLNRHLAGRDSVRLSEAPGLEQGIRLAQVESPDLIVCSTEDTRRSPAELGHLFKEAQLGPLPVVCVHDQANGETPAEGAGSNFSVCTPDDFLKVVERVIEPPPPSAGTSVRVNLLSHFETLSGPPGEPNRGFVNLLEMDSHTLLIESSQLLQIGDFLDLAFYLPYPPDTAPPIDRPRVLLRCEIRQCRDENKLLYGARIQKIEQGSEATWRRFLSTAAQDERA